MAAPTAQADSRRSGVRSIDDGISLRASSNRNLPTSDGGIAGSCSGSTQTQSIDPSTLEGGASVYCGTLQTSSETWLARSFGLQNLSTAVGCVQFGVDENVGGAWPVEVVVMVGDIAGTDALAVLFSTTTLIPANVAGTIETVSFPPVQIPPGSDLVVALRTPSRFPQDGGDGGRLILGFNDNGETAPTWIKAGLCGVNDFVTTGSVGFPNSHLVMTVGSVPSALDACGTGGNCFGARVSAGCQSAACCTHVCAGDPFCCDVRWDESCVTAAISGCAAVLADDIWHVPQVAGTKVSVAPDGLLVAPIAPSDPRVPFGYTLHVHDAFDDPAGKPTGARSDLVEWTPTPGSELGFVFDTSAFGGGSDAVSFVGLPGGGAVLDVRSVVGSCTALGVRGSTGDVLLGDYVVGTIEDLTAGPIVVTTNEPLGKFTFWGFCKGKKVKTTTTNPDGSTTTTETTEWTYGFGGSKGGSTSDDPVLYTFSQNGQVLVGDSIVIRPDVPAMCSPPSSISVYASGLPSFLVKNGANPRFGLWLGMLDSNPIPLSPFVVETSVGVEVVPVAPDSGITWHPTEVDSNSALAFHYPPGASTPDGAQLVFGDAASVELDVGIDLLPGTTGACVSFSTILVGGGDGGTVAFDPCPFCPPPFKGGWNVAGDFTNVGTGTYTLVAYLNGAPVAAAPGGSGVAVTALDTPKKIGKLGGQTPCYRIKWPTQTSLRIASSGVVVEADEIRLLAEGSVGPTHIESITMTATNVDVVTLSVDEIELPVPSFCIGDLDGDGVVGGADLASLLGSWGSAGADLDGNGIVDAADLSLLLGAWGPCP
jgi:hypothetical protein